MIKFFEIVNNELVILRDEFILIKEFKVIWTRLRSMEGDRDGRYKKLNTLECAYIQKMGDALMDSNLYAGFNEQERDTRIRQDIGLPKGWSPDSFLKTAIDKYCEIQTEYSPSVVILKNIHQSLMLSGNAISSINKQLTGLVKRNNDLIGDEMSIEETVTVTENSKAIVALIGEVLNLGKTIPKTIAEIQAFEASIRKEIGSKERVKSSGKKVGLFEDPD
jgi:hypothetical protein